MKRYNENERQYLIKRLKVEAADCIKLYGVKKTTIEHLISRVNIPCGTLYLMFPIKEQLFYEVVCEYRIETIHKFQTRLEQAMPLTAEVLTAIIQDIFDETMNSLLLQVARNEEMEYMMRKLPEELFKEKEAEIKELSRHLLDFLPTDSNMDFDEILTAFEILFYSVIRKSRIGAELYDRSLNFLLDALARRLIKTDRPNDNVKLPLERS